MANLKRKDKGDVNKKGKYEQERKNKLQEAKERRGTKTHKQSI